MAAKDIEPYHWKKGQSGNPSGGRKHNPLNRAIRQFTTKTFRKLINLAFTSNVEELATIAKSKKKPAIEVAIARSFLTAIQKGDYGVIERIAERIVGKVPDKIIFEEIRTIKVKVTAQRELLKLSSEEIQKRISEINADV